MKDYQKTSNRKLWLATLYGFLALLTIVFLRNGEFIFIFFYPFLLLAGFVTNVSGFIVSLNIEWKNKEEENIKNQYLVAHGILAIAFLYFMIDAWVEVSNYRFD